MICAHRYWPWPAARARQPTRMIRIPSPAIAGASGTSMADLADRTFWARTTMVITAIQGDAHGAQRHQHRHQPDARPGAAPPEAEPRTGAVAAAPAELLLERRELVGACGDHSQAGGHRPVRPVHRLHPHACPCPDGPLPPTQPHPRPTPPAL